MLRLFNTLTRKKELFKPLSDGVVSMYNCGLTVYDHATIGNLRAFTFADLLRRYLEYKGFKVKQVMNFTDVGHMFEDVDVGKDKIEVTARKEKKDPWVLAEFYINEFLDVTQLMNFEEPMNRPRATEHIKEMIELVERLIARGFAYTVEGSVYFDVKKFEEYGKLSGNTLDKLKIGAGGRVEFNPDKRNQFDFALWIRDPEHIMNWKSPWCEKGYPGWHIECSAMAMKYLGEKIDIHTGGIDNIFPHHENEIAQSEAVTERKYVNYWLHVEYLLVEGQRMGKSLGNYYTLKDIVAKGYSPKDLRFLLLSTHYRQQLNFTMKGLEAAKNVVTRLEDFNRRLGYTEGYGDKEHVENLMYNVKKQFEMAMDDDLNISLALSTIFDFMREVNRLIDKDMISRKDTKKIYNLMVNFDKVLGVLNELEENRISKETKDLIQKREKARRKKNWKEADSIRKELEEKGIFIEDTSKGPRIRQVNQD